LKEKRLFLTSPKQTCNEYLISSLRIRVHLSWRTGKHLYVLHVLRTYSTCSYPGYQDTTTYAALTECYRVLKSVTDCYRLLQSATECYRVFLAHLLGPIFGFVSHFICHGGHQKGKIGSKISATWCSFDRGRGERRRWVKYYLGSAKIQGNYN